MKLLAIDTTAAGCSAAVSLDGRLIARYEDAPRQHTRRIMPMIHAVLSEAKLSPQDLDLLAFGRGPGSFTGLRIAAGLIQGLAFGLDIPVMPVSSLAAVALKAVRHFQLAEGDMLLPAFDARMDEIYYGIYTWRSGALMALAEDSLAAPEALSLPAACLSGPSAPRIFGAGDGWAFAARFPQVLQQNLSDSRPDLLPGAAEVAELALNQWVAQQNVGPQDFVRQGAVSAEQALPVYLRDEVAWKKLAGR